jgi:pyruvate dehydrogenase E2 component (dihydrolipoamide acetyltransferase)
MGEFRMPSLGADMEAGTLVEWLKHVGDRVKRGDIVAVVETHKGAIEIEIFEDGTIERLVVSPGAKVPVGTPLAFVRTDGAPATEAAAAPAAKPRQPAPPLAVTPPGTPAPIARRGERVRASPAARRMAAARGLPLGAIQGTGPDGAIVSVDVERAVSSREGQVRPRGVDLAGMRKAIAAAMSRSKREIPHYYLTHTIDVSCALEWLTATNAARKPADRLLSSVLVLKAVARALRAHPGFNGFYLENGFQPSEGIHIGTAIAIRGGGLTAPAIHDVDRLSLDELMARLRDLVARTRAGTLRSSELSDATVTVTNLGERGVEALLGIIYPPQVAILGFGTPMRRPWIREERVEARSLITASLSADHRVSDGHGGALLLAEIDTCLQQPERL